MNMRLALAAFGDDKSSLGAASLLGYCSFIFMIHKIRISMSLCYVGGREGGGGGSPPGAITSSNRTEPLALARLKVSECRSRSRHT